VATGTVDPTAVACTLTRAANMISADSKYAGDELTILKSQLPLADVNCDHPLHKFLQLAERAHAHLRLPHLQDAYAKDSRFFCVFVQTNLIHPVCGLIAEYADITISSGVNRITGDGVISHPAVAVVAHALHRSLHLSADNWHFPTPSPFHPTVARQHLLGFLLWDGWLRLPDQAEDRQKVAATSPLFLAAYGNGPAVLSKHWKYGR
jgi:hypothetical protein